MLLLSEQIFSALQPLHPQLHFPFEEFLNDLNIINPAKHTIKAVTIISIILSPPTLLNISILRHKQIIKS